MRCSMTYGSSVVVLSVQVVCTVSAVCMLSSIILTFTCSDISPCGVSNRTMVNILFSFLQNGPRQLLSFYNICSSEEQHAGSVCIAVGWCIMLFLFVSRQHHNRDTAFTMSCSKHSVLFHAALSAFTEELGEDVKHTRRLDSMIW